MPINKILQIDELLKNKIKEDILITKSMAKTSKKFNISLYLVKQITGWNREDYLKEHKKKYGTIEQQKKRKYERDLKRLRRPDVKERNSKIIKERNYKKCFRRMMINANKSSQYKDGNKISKFDIWKIAKKQKLRCAISGLKLTLDNISLDHIKAISDGGTNTIDNLQLVDYRINLMKRELSMEVFLNWIKEIYNHNFNK